ncbi:hypothetical protein [Methylobacterium sp. A54F]
MAETAALPRSMPDRRSRPGASVALFLGILAFLTLQGAALLNDPDTQWHVAVGDRILADRALPWTDPFSHTFAGAPWIAKEWLSQLLLSIAHRFLGWPGVVLLAGVSAAGAFALLHAWLARRLIWSAALGITLVAALATAPHLLARPHLLTFPLVVLWTCGLVDAVERRAGPPWALLVVLALWANLHAGFTIAFPVAGLMAAEAVAGAASGQRRAMLLRWGVFLAGCPFAACLTPYGAHAIWITASLFGTGEPLPFITEWQPLPLDAAGAGTRVVMLALPALLVLREPGRHLWRVLLLALLATMAIRHARFLDLYALIAPVLVAAPLARLWPALAAGRPPQAPAQAPIEARLGGLAPLGLGLVCAVALIRPVAPDPDVTPVAALDAARARGLTAGPVYNHYDFGGFLIGAGVRTFIDGRTDQLFLGGFTRTLMEALAAQDDGSFLDLLDRSGVTWALVRTGSDDARHLSRGAGWARVHADAAAEVYARRPGA